MEHFTGESVPIKVASQVMRKSQDLIRQGIRDGSLPIGKAIKKNGSSKYTYYISPKAFYDLTGYKYEP